MIHPVGYRKKHTSLILVTGPEVYLVFLRHKVLARETTCVECLKQGEHWNSFSDGIVQAFEHSIMKPNDPGEPTE